VTTGAPGATLREAAAVLVGAAAHRHNVVGALARQTWGDSRRPGPGEALRPEDIEYAALPPRWDPRNRHGPLAGTTPEQLTHRMGTSSR